MEKKLISHRGYKQGFLENSRAALEKALKEGLSFETDIRTTNDGVPFLIHDDTIDRLLNGSGLIAAYYADELELFMYKEDKSQKLVSLDEFCKIVKELYKNGLIFIHIKELDAVEPSMKIFQEYGFEDRLRFFAVDKIALKFVHLMKEKYPKYKVGLYLPENSPDFTDDKMKMADFIWADEITFKWIDKKKVDLAHELGKPFYAISPELIPKSIFNKNIEERWKELIDDGVDAICTGKPDDYLKFI